MAFHSDKTATFVTPVQPDQPPSGTAAWLREMARGVNSANGSSTGGGTGPPGPAGPAGPTGPTGPAGSANMSGMVAGQIPIAATATSVTASTASLAASFMPAYTGDVTSPAGSTVNTLATVPVAKGGTNKTSWTAGSVAFAASATALGEDNGNLFWDDTNNRLGIGTAAPTLPLEVNGHAIIRNDLYIRYTNAACITCDTFAAGFNKWLDNAGAQSVWLGNASNYYMQGSHLVTNVGASVTYAQFLVSGNYQAGGGTWQAISDVRTKEGVEDYRAGLDEIRKLRPVRYKHNGRGGTARDGRIYTGLVADEVLGVMPEMVGKTRVPSRPYEDEEDTEFLTLDGTSLIYALVTAVKELAARVEAIEARLNQ